MDSALALGGDDRNKNCPICDKFSKGPCGALFKRWLKCTDDHPGKNPNNLLEDLHLSKCSREAEALARCLEANESYYERNPFAADAEVSDDETEVEGEEASDDVELQEAWERLIFEDLKDIPRQPFPSLPNLKPKLEFRPKDRLSVIYFNLQDIQQQPQPQQPQSKSNSTTPLSLLLVFVQDSTNNKKVLSAGSIQDLYLLDSGTVGVLQCTIPPSTNEIIVSALYENSSNNQIIFTHTARIPKH